MASRGVKGVKEQSNATESKIAAYPPTVLPCRGGLGERPGEEIRKGYPGADSRPGAGVWNSLDGLQVSRSSDTNCLGPQSFGSDRQGETRRQADHHRRLYGLVRMVQGDGCQDLEPSRRHRTKRELCLP